MSTFPGNPVLYRIRLGPAIILLVGISVSVLGMKEDDFCVGKKNGLLPDPVRCEKFYHCFDHRSYSMPCAPGTSFNSKISVCDWPENVNCDDNKMEEKGGICKGKENGNYRDPEFCQRYYVCHEGRSFSFECAKGLFFDPELVICDFEQNVDCTATAPKPKPGSEEPMEKTEYIGAVEATQVKMTTKSSKCPRLVCYFTNWAQYRDGDAKQKPEDIDPSKCTHIIFAFAKLEGNRLAPFEWNDEDTEWSMGNYRKVADLKKEYTYLKVLLAVGGWNMASAPFTAMVATPDSRKEFVDTSITFLRDRGFDGLDLDWEYPANRGGPPEDKARFSDLLRELRAAYTQEVAGTNRPQLLLTAAVAAGKSVIDSAYDVPVLNSELDFINLMSYDLHGAWDGKTGHNSPLYAGSWEKGMDAQLNVKWAANYWVEKGASREKLVIGMSFYGRTFRLDSSSINGVGASTKGPGKAGSSTREAGILAYYEICQMTNTGSSKKMIDEQEVPYVVSGDQWAGYDDSDSLKKKTKFSRDNGFGGVMVWDISFDDITGNFCSKGKYPLLSALNEGCN